MYSDAQLTIKLDDIEGMDRQYVQIQGKDRKQVAAAGKALGLESTYIARSYIEQVRPDLAGPWQTAQILMNIWARPTPPLGAR